MTNLQLHGPIRTASKDRVSSAGRVGVLLVKAWSGVGAQCLASQGACTPD